MRTPYFLASVTLMLLISIPQASGAPPGGHLNISQVFVDDPDNPTSIMIFGEDLLTGPQGPSVTLGHIGTLSIIGTPTDTLIEASLPAPILDGDYLLTVSGGTGQSQNDEYDLTIGAVGPQGNPGLQGDLGPQGDPGADGADGAPGADGTDGADGADGADGDDGADGAQGPQGDPGVLTFPVGNTAGGDNALAGNTTGGSNTAFGIGALQNNTTGNRNTAHGASSLASSMTGSDNTAIGNAALVSNTTGQANTGVGRRALQGNDTGSINTAVGVDAMHDNTSGHENTAFGGSALRSNTIGIDNVANGASALFQNTEGIRNTGIGRQALLNNTTGNRNIGVGFQAGGNYTTEDDNIAVGNEGVAGESGAIRIGTATTQNATFIAGISTSDLSTIGSPVVIDANGRLGVGAYSVVVNTTAVCNAQLPNATCASSAICPAGSVAVGGGAEVQDFNRDVLVVNRIGGANDAWLCQARNIDSYGIADCNVYVVCATSQ